MTSMSVPAIALATGFLLIALLLSACAREPVREVTTTQQTTTIQPLPAPQTTTTTTTRTQQTTP